MASIKLYGLDKSPSSPTTAGYCQKLETFLRASSFENYSHHATLPYYAPKKKLPYIELTSASTPEIKTLADSHFIICHLIENKLVPDPDADLTPAQRAESRAWIGYTDELLYPAVVHTRWARPENYAVTVSTLPVPWYLQGLMGWYARRTITNALWTAGVGRHSDAEIDQLMREWVDAVDARLRSGGKYFHGDRATLVDIDVYAFLVTGVRCGKGNRGFLEMVLGKEGLREYVSRLTRLWFPEYEEVLEVLEGK